MIALTAGAIVFARYGFSRLRDFVEHNIDKDFMVLFSIGIALGYSGLAIILGLSEVLGAFLAGVMLAETRRTDDFDKILIPIKNLTLPFFFLHFGASIQLEGTTVPHLHLLVLIIVISVAAKVAVGIFGGRAFGLKRKVAIRSGFSLIQRGEFSIVIAAMGHYPINLLGGIYVIITALLGVFSFEKAPAITRYILKKTKDK